MATGKISFGKFTETDPEELAWLEIYRRKAVASPELLLLLKIQIQDYIKKHGYPYKQKGP